MWIFPEDFIRGNKFYVFGTLTVLFSFALCRAIHQCLLWVPKIRNQTFSDTLRKTEVNLLLLLRLSHIFKPLLDRTGSRGRCWAAIQLPRRPEPSGIAVYWEVCGLDIGRQHGRRFFFWNTNTGRRGGNTLFVQAAAEVQKRLQKAEASDTRTVAIKVDLDSSWKGHSNRVGVGVRMKVRCLVRLSSHSALPWWFAQCAARMLLLSDELMSCCVAGTYGCLDMRRRAFIPCGQMTAEWSKCPCSMGRRSRESVASLQRSSTG